MRLNAYMSRLDSNQYGTKDLWLRYVWCYLVHHILQILLIRFTMTKLVSHEQTHNENFAKTILKFGRALI